MIDSLSGDMIHHRIHQQVHGQMSQEEGCQHVTGEENVLRCLCVQESSSGHVPSLEF